MTRIPDVFVASPSINETGPGIPGVSITALIKRLEKATGPSRELDALIARAVRHPVSAIGTALPDWVHNNFHDWEVLSGGRLKAGCIWEAPRFTASVDAALTLVPEGLCIAMTFSLTAGSWYGKQAVAQLRTGSLTDPTTEEWDGDASTPSLALCIAALRARASRDTPSKAEGTDAAAGEATPNKSTSVMKE